MIITSYFLEELSKDDMKDILDNPQWPKMKNG